MAETPLQIKFGVVDVQKVLSALERMEKKLDGFVNKADDAGKKTESAFQKMNRKVDQRLTSLAKMFVKYGSVIAGVMAAAVTKFAADFEYQMAEVATLVDTAIVDMNKFADEIIDMSTKSNKSLSDLTKGLYQTLSASIDAADAMEFLDVAQRAAVAGVATVEQSVDALTTTINAYGFSAKDAEYISDVFFETIKRGKTTFSELSGSIGQVLPIAKQAGVEFEEVMAVLTTLTKAGLNTAEA